MACFMNYAHDCATEIGLIVASRYSHIAWHAATKWMATHIQPAVIKVKP